MQQIRSHGPHEGNEGLDVLCKCSRPESLSQGFRRACSCRVRVSTCVRVSCGDIAAGQAMKAMKAMKAARAAPKGEIAKQLAESTGLKKSDVMSVLDTLADIGTKELKKAGKFTLPGLVMIKTRKKKATKAGKRMMFGKEVKVKAQPAKTVVKAFPVKASGPGNIFRKFQPRNPKALNTVNPKSE